MSNVSDYWSNYMNHVGQSTVTKLAVSVRRMTC